MLAYVCMFPGEYSSDQLGAELGIEHSAIMELSILMRRGLVRLDTGGAGWAWWPTRAGRELHEHRPRD